jgi:signal transduction histidine kinase
VEITSSGTEGSTGEAAHSQTGGSAEEAAHRQTAAKHDRSWSARRISAALGWYAAALGLVGLTAWFRWLTDPILGEVSRFLPFILVVAVCTYGGGLGPGVFSLGLSACAGTFLFVNRPLLLTTVDVVNLGIFVVQAGGVAVLTAALRRARDQAQSSASRAQAAVRQKDQFVARVSHEWRAPLNVLSGWTSQLASRPDDPEFVARAASNMMRAIETQQRLVQDLFDYSRGSRGRLSIHPVRLLITTPIEASFEAVRQEAAEKNISLTLGLDDPGLRVWGDNQRLQQVFVNLLTNAIKFTPKGGRITMTGRRVDDRVELRVEDNGAGIDPNLLQEVFEPFAQGRPIRDEALGGLGLGLSITREIVLLHAGTIDASSAGPGHGSTFTVRLPVSAALADKGVAEHDTTLKRRG